MTAPSLTSDSLGWRFDHSYARLPAPFFRKMAPTPVREPQMVIFNGPLATHLGLDAGLSDRPDLLSGNALPSNAEPIAQAYAGHQYAHFTMLGDGRAILLGEQITPEGLRFDVQLKGPGLTPFSRRGDGRAALGPMLREYIISEAMHALGIPTTRSLAVVATGETVYRQEPLPGAVLTRIAASHLRVGTFEWAAARGEIEPLRTLTDYTLKRHFAERSSADNPALALLEAVVERQASLIARWMHVGFIHGVMNSDNMALSGETIDYGPCAFMNAFDPETVFSSIDQHGRYAYGQQPHIAQWNLARFAEALLPLFDENEQRSIEIANEAVRAFQPQFQEHWLAGMRSKLGLFNAEPEDTALMQGLLEWMRATSADYTLTFRRLSTESLAEEPLASDPEFQSWHQGWTARRGRQPQTLAESVALMRRSNPAVIPRNHQVEAALQAASERSDLAPLHRLLEALARPFEDSPAHLDYAQPPASGGPRYRTFCGT